ncbi:MAG: GGDEF domain-containing protein [Epsilonproteobacteria bacterium]|nr:GGDEF domain-containing protein [Campylobacterota bacterium]
MGAKIKNIKVSSLVVGIFDDLTHFSYITDNIFKDHNIFLEEKKEWLKLSDWLNAQNEVKEIFGSVMLFYIGKKTFHNAKWSKNIDSLEKALKQIDCAYKNTHTKGDIGNYLFKKCNDMTFYIHAKTPYQSEFNLGILRGLCDIFTPKEQKSTITIDKKQKLDKIYKDNTIYKIQLSPHSEKIETKKTPKWVNDKNHLTDKVLEESFVVMNEYINRFQKLQEKLEKQAYKDQLTQLDNRFKLDLYADTIFKQLIRDKENINIAMFDIDFFKQYNDKNGHSKGDTLLKQIAHIISKNANRPCDLAVRYGGEELLLFLPYIGNTDALNITEKIRKEIEQLKEQITISVGLMHKQIKMDDDLYSMIDLTDKLLYRAKNNGRNRVISCIY